MCQGCIGRLAGSVGTWARRGIGSTREHWGLLEGVGVFRGC